MRASLVVRRVLSLILAVALAAVILVAMLISQTGYSMEDMDWDGDGHTSISELLDAIDTGSRVVIDSDGRSCIEIYAKKDGLPIKRKCK